MKSNFLAETIKWVHNLILVYALSGWLCEGNALLFYIIFNVIMMLQWLVNKNRCILTQWESVLRGGTFNLEARSDTTFVGAIFHRLFGYYPEYFVITLFSYGITLFCTAIGIAKYYALA